VLRRLARDQWVRLHGTPRVTVLVGGARGREIWSQWLALSGMAGTLLEGAAAEPGGAERIDGVERRDARDAIDDPIRAAVARAVADPAHPIAVVVTAEAVLRWRAGRSDRLAAMVDEGWLAVPEDAAGEGRARSRTGGDAHGEGEGRSGGHAGGVFDGRFGGGGGGGGAGGGGAGGGGAGGGGAGGGGGGGGGALGGAAGGGGGGGGGALGGAAGLAGVTPRRWFQLDARSLAEATLFEALEATPATAGRFRLNESLAVRFGPAAAEIDLLSRGDRIAIEIDGVHHFADPDCYRRDRRKDLLLQTHGFVVVRLLAEDVVRDVRAAVTAVSQALAYRLAEGRR
jgi:very-short-patch-repair endonuclease